MFANRCPDCGGVANHYLIDVKGDSYYRCMDGLTTFRREGSELTRVSHIEHCDTIIDSRGKKFTGTVAFATEGKVKTLAFTNGKERR